MATLLDVKNIEVVYDKSILAVRQVSLSVPEGSIVALLGANGAGKSTTLKAISQLVYAENGQINRGDIVYQGQSILGQNPSEVVKKGLVQVLEGRHIFANLTVDENLRTGGFLHHASASLLKQQLDKIYSYFPRLLEKKNTLAGYTSGGEQQMLAIGRALMTKPRLILLDEPSMGLAPIFIKEIFSIIQEIQAQGTTVLLIEQNAKMALSIANRGYVLETGKIVLEGTGKELLASEAVRKAYLGG